MNEPSEKPKSQPPKGAFGKLDPPRTIPSEDLLQGGREVLIRHEGEIYRLRLTRNGKLILQK